MKSALLWRLVIGVSFAAAAAPVAAEGWKFPNLNPFKTEEKEVSPYVPAPPPTNIPDFEAPEEESGSGFKFPTFKMPKVSMPGSSPGKPSAMKRMTQGTKNFFSKTADVLTPWDNDEPAPRSRTATGVRRRYNGSPNAAKEEKSLFSSWFSKKEEPQEPRTVNGFIAQPRPRF